MRAHELALQNFAIAEHLLQLHQLLRDLRGHEANQPLSLAVCECLALPPGSALQHSKNSHALLSAHSAIPVPSCLTAPAGVDFLLRQAVLVSCSALESFFWDVLRENALTVVKAKGRKSDDSLKNVTLTLDDYLSLQSYTDPDARLEKIILKRFERGTLYDIGKLDEIATILTVPAKDFWKEVSKKTGQSDSEIKTRLGALVNRRNDITHRADRPEAGTPASDCDAHGLRPITYGWVMTHVTCAKALVDASASIFASAVTKLQSIIAHQEEQRLAQATLAPAPAPATP
jgi:hypothetical protein